MTLKEFVLKENNHFVAMEYYNLIMNRIFLVLVTHEKLIALKVNGMVSIESGGNILANEMVKSLVVRGDLSNPYSYIKEKYIRDIENINFLSDEALNKHKGSFVISRDDIKSAWHNSNKKWGMGYYPHDGRVYIETVQGGNKELIILGNQSGEEIVNMIYKK
ncbi:hypothetical protein KLP40_10910 [Hymenobacter sp. NST-14]|uniref:hypothetical protein n=1 Tax=Hymenobacter piscis TaxID=2839984 RepID=UPI001C02D61E|nr:hypothetical protein [Hymenobacter piscis]MBT9393673.1 hypothetical protein [Hymenobacter piscis]